VPFKIIISHDIPRRAPRIIAASPWEPIAIEHEIAARLLFMSEKRFVGVEQDRVLALWPVRQTRSAWAVYHRNGRIH
jgi:hypothetical protein